MEKYEIIMTPDAISDLKGLNNYISDVLASKYIARSYLDEIRKKISSLAHMPERIKLMEQEPWHSRGIWYMIVKNFNIYFRIDKTENRVYILNIIYAKRDQLSQLMKNKEHI